MNDFKKDLEFSHSASDDPMWTIIYGRAFPGFKSMTDNRCDSQMQRVGVDRTLIMRSGKAVYIDEKARRPDKYTGTESFKNNIDIMLEYVSNDRKKSPGWSEKDLFCDYIAYNIIAIKRCFLFPVPQMQSAWFANKEAWLNLYGTRAAKNYGYKTLNYPVPYKVLYREILGLFHVEWCDI